LPTFLLTRHVFTRFTRFLVRNKWNRSQCWSIIVLCERHCSRYTDVYLWRQNISGKLSSLLVCR